MSLIENKGDNVINPIWDGGGGKKLPPLAKNPK